MEINLKNNMEMSVFTFTNNTAGIIRQDGYTHNYGNGNINTLFVCMEYIVNFSVVGNKTKMYVTKRSDNTQVKEVRYSDSKEFSFSTTNTIFFNPVYVHNNIFILRYLVDAYKDYYYILDMNTGIIKKTNAKHMSVDNMVDIGSKVVFARCICLTD